MSHAVRGFVVAAVCGAEEGRGGEGRGEAGGMVQRQEEEPRSEGRMKRAVDDGYGKVYGQARLARPTQPNRLTLIACRSMIGVPLTFGQDSR